MNSKDFEKLKAQMAELTPEQLKMLVQSYAQATGGDTRREWDKSIFTVSEQHLAGLGINRACPYCGSTAVVHNGKTAAGVQRFRCLLKRCRRYYRKILLMPAKA